MHTKIAILLVLIIGISTYFVFSNRSEAPTVNEVPAASEDAERESDASDQEGPDTSEEEREVSNGTDEGMEFPTLEDEPIGDEPFAELVTYTGDGFDPEIVTIAKGETVRFVNQSGRNMWVGADLHPTHTQFPIKAAADCLGSSFDQCEAVPDGNFWEFTFDATGSFNYHNHVFARHGGTVVVDP